MKLGGVVLKKFFSLAALLLSISFLLLGSTSFTTAEIGSDATLSIVSEDSALIAITNWEGRTFAITNNTEETIEIEEIKIIGRFSEEAMNGVENDSTPLLSGASKYFTLIGNSQELSGSDIYIFADWNSGSAEISSTIPEFEDEKVLDELVEEQIESEIIEAEEEGEEKVVGIETEVESGKVEGKETEVESEKVVEKISESEANEEPMIPELDKD